MSTSDSKMQPKEYREYLRKIDLANIQLNDVKATLGKVDFSVRPVMNLTEGFKILKNVADHAIIEVSYKVSAKVKRSNVFTVNAKYHVSFVTNEQIPDDFFEIYNQLSLPLQTFPYLRELTNSIISRMGLPPLILPLRKFLVGENS